MERQEHGNCLLHPTSLVGCLPGQLRMVEHTGLQQVEKCSPGPGESLIWDFTQVGNLYNLGANRCVWVFWTVSQRCYGDYLSGEQS